MALSRQHPVLSPAGCLGGLALSIGVAVALFISGGAIFSPGGLTAQAAQGVEIKGYKSHADFENDCMQCHEPLHGLTADKCQACHTDVAEQRAAGTGVHGLKTNDMSDCAACHRDHEGQAYNPSELALKKFDHSTIGFSLTRHIINYDQSPLACKACHTAEGNYKLSSTAACTDCHGAHDATFMAAHTAAFGVQCLTCHDGVDKTHGFDHAQTKFPLEGQHINLGCGDCHRPSLAAQDTPANCAGCHAEPPVHASVFGDDCASCHTAAAWKPAKLENRLAFDHEAASFKLIYHAKNYDSSPLNCRTCHTAGDYSFTAQTCTDCHSAHDAAFMAQHIEQYGSDCLSCHDGAGNMKNFDHSRFFVLDGRHATVECAACHLNQQFKGTPKECSACHREPEIHAGLFGLKCEACHTTTAWAPAQLTQHTFPLDHGGQGEITCATCHTASYVTYTCYGCHEHDPAKTREEHAEQNIPAGELDACAACHADGRKEAGG
jgi:hypothetical protein